MKSPYNNKKLILEEAGLNLCRIAEEQLQQTGIEITNSKIDFFNVIKSIVTQEPIRVDHLHEAGVTSIVWAKYKESHFRVHGKKLVDANLDLFEDREIVRWRFDWMVYQGNSSCIDSSQDYTLPEIIKLVKTYSNDEKIKP
jgi:hypothetical protein